MGIKNLKTLYVGLIWMASAFAFAQPAKPSDPWARDQEITLNDKAGKPLLLIKVAFLGHQPPEGYTNHKADHEKQQHDFYQRTLTNLSNQPLRFTSMVIRTRLGVSTVTTQEKGESAEKFGTEVKVDIERSPVVKGNELAPGQSAKGTFFIRNSKAREALDTTMGVEQAGVNYLTSYQLVYLRK